MASDHLHPDTAFYVKNEEKLQFLSFLTQVKIFRQNWTEFIPSNFSKGSFNTASQLEGPELDSRPGLSGWSNHAGFPLGTAVSFLTLTAMNVIGYVSFYVRPVVNWRIVRGGPCLRPLVAGTGSSSPPATRSGT